MLVVFLSTLLRILCVSFTTLVVVFSLVEILTGTVGPAGPQEMLILFVMALAVSLWNTLIRSTLSSAKAFLLRYAGGTGIVLGIGIAWGGVVPLEMDTILIVCAIVAVVYAGTWLYLYMAAKREAADINRWLRARRMTRSGRS